METGDNYFTCGDSERSCFFEASMDFGLDLQEGDIYWNLATPDWHTLYIIP